MLNHGHTKAGKLWECDNVLFVEQVLPFYTTLATLSVCFLYKRKWNKSETRKKIKGTDFGQNFSKELHKINIYSLVHYIPAPHIITPKIESQ